MEMSKDNEWKKEHTVFLGMRLQKSTDADLLAWLDEHGSSKQGEIKRLMRIAIAAEQNKQ